MSAAEDTSLALSFDEAVEGALGLKACWPSLDEVERELVDTLAARLVPPGAEPDEWWAWRWMVWEQLYCPVLQAAADMELFLVDGAHLASLQALASRAQHYARTLDDPKANEPARTKALAQLLEAVLGEGE